MIVVLDSTPLALLCSPIANQHVQACNTWLKAISQACRIVLPEIIDYELRRELLRMNSVKSLHRLDRLTLRLSYLPITTEAMRKAADLWALARNNGIPTASDASIDIDVILAAQCLCLHATDTLIATGNVAHLSRFTHAAEWHTINSGHA